nr:hypothetical protein [Tanacetum cinerariifolium]
VSAHDHVDQENVIEEIANDVAPPTSPLPPSPIIPSLPPHQSPRTSPSQATEGSSILVRQVLDKCSALVFRVEGLESDNTAQQLEILKLKARVKKLERLNKDKLSKLRRLKKAGTSQRIESSEDEENVFNHGRISVDIDEGIELVDDQEKDAQPKVLKVVPAAPTISTRKRKGVVIRDHEEELHDETPAETQSAKDKGKEEESHAQAKDVQAKDAPAKRIQYIRRYHGYKKKPQFESEARKNMIAYLKNTEGFKMAFFKGKTYDQICLIFQARFDANMRFLLKSKEEMEKEEE